jgi:hypothetical protein
MAKKKSAKKKATKKIDSTYLEEFDVTDGKDRSSKEKHIQETRELELLLGVTQCNPYETLSKDVFQDRIATASVAELTDLAVRVGVTPARNTSLLKKDLLKSFEIFATKHNVSVQGQAKPIIDPSSPDYDSAVKLFGDI